MGCVIKERSAAQKILTDLEITLDAAELAKGAWHEEAQRVLAPSARLAFQAELDRAEAQKALDLEHLTLEAIQREANLACAHARDEVRNLLQRPGDNVELDIAFPPMRSITPLSAGDKADQFEVIAKLLELGTIRRIAAGDCEVVIEALRAPIPKLSAVAASYEKARKKRNVCQALRNGCVRSARLQLVHLKRIYKTYGYSEPEIDRIIPDRKKVPGEADTPAPVVTPEEPSAPLVPLALDSAVPVPRPLEEGEAEEGS